MTTLESPKIEDRRSHERSQLEAAIKEARRRQRRRWLAGGALVLAVAVGVGVGTTEFNGGRTGDNASAPSRPSSQRASTRSGLSGLNACGLLSTTDAAPILGSPVSGEAFTELGFPISPNTAPNPTYSQCRFTSTTSQSQMRLIINASAATAPPVSEEAIAARAQPGYRVLTIDRALTVWAPWTQQNLRGQGGVLSSTEHGYYVSVTLIYVHRHPERVAEHLMQIALSKLG
jgi:hypothetical protein